MVRYVHAALAEGRQVAVLIPEVEPRRRRYQIPHNQRGLILATALRVRTDAIVCTLPYRLDPDRVEARPQEQLPAEGVQGHQP